MRFWGWFRQLFERLKNDPATAGTLQDGKWVVVHKIRQIKAEADCQEAQAEETRANARAKDAETLVVLIEVIDKLQARGQMAWISMEGGQPRLHVGERGPGPPWVPLYLPAPAIEVESVAPVENREVTSEQFGECSDVADDDATRIDTAGITAR